MGVLPMNVENFMDGACDNNEKVWMKVGIERELLVTIRKRQLEFWGHVMRKEGLKKRKDKKKKPITGWKGKREAGGKASG